jgi:predicted transcriptional regulator
MLGKGEIVKDCLETPLKSLNYFLASIGTSKEIRGISPILITGYSMAISHLVKNGSNVEIIVTKPVLDAILLKNTDLIVNLLEKENFRLFKIDKNIKISFLVSESFLNLGLARVDGSYDLGTDLVYTGDSAIQWGRSLYDYYRSQSTQVIKPI